MDTFGSRLKKARLINNIEQKDIAYALKISISSYSGYENNYRIPSVKRLIALAKYLNVTTDYLLGININNDINKEEVIVEIEEIEDKLKNLKGKISSHKK